VDRAGQGEEALIKRIPGICTVFFLVLSLIPAGHAADATLAEANGRVKLTRAGKSFHVAARKGDALSFGDKIQTGEGAVAHIVFKDGATVLVKGSSKLTLSGSKKDAIVSFDIGEFLIGLKRKLRKDEKFSVKTPAATAAIRGTLFWGLSDDNKDTTYACFVDQIEIEAAGRKLMLEKGQKVKIPFGESPGNTEPANVPLSYLDTFAVNKALQGLPNLLKE
jgi:ferric-dicitrate binding protein FerR (iron transport regulator)